MRFYTVTSQLVKVVQVRKRRLISRLTRTRAALAFVLRCLPAVFAVSVSAFFLARLVYSVSQVRKSTRR